MKKIILAVVVAAISSGAVADQFDAANGELTNALQDRAMHFNNDTNLRINRAYTRAKEAAIEASGQNNNAPLAASATPANAVENTDRTHDQIASTIERQGEVRQYQSGFMSSVSKTTEEANTPTGVSSEVVNNKDSLSAPLNTTTNASTDIANPSQVKNTPLANTASATVDVANTPTTKNTPIDTTSHATIDVDRTRQQVTSNALRQGEVRQSMDTRISSVSKASEKANIPAGTSSDVIHEQSSLNAPLSTQTHFSVDAARPSEVRSTPAANTFSATVEVATPAATINKPEATTKTASTTGGSYRAVVSKMQSETMNISAHTLSPDTKVATPEGKVVSAGSLPASTQVAMPFNSAFSRPQHGGNHRSHEHGNHHGGSSDNGGSNAQNSRSAGGLADSHVGGGKEGGAFHY